MSYGFQGYSNTSQRIGKYKGEILKGAVPVEVLGITGEQKSMPKNSSDTVVYRRWYPFGGVDNRWISATNVGTFAGSHQINEGENPEADTLSPIDITAQMLQYGVLYKVSDRAVDIHEDGPDIPQEMTRQTGERVGLVREMIRYGTLKAATNAFYAGGTSRDTVDGTVSLAGLRSIERSLRLNHAAFITRVLAPSPDFNTSPTEAGYLVFHHTDMDHDVRSLPDFVSVPNYGSRKPVHENEIGSVGRFRFISSPELAPYAAAGANVAGTGLSSAGGSKVDVYPLLIAAENAWGQVALRGLNSVTPTWIPPGQQSKSDPLGLVGYVGAKFWFSCVLLNQGWLAVYECGASALTA